MEITRIGTAWLNTTFLLVGYESEIKYNGRAEYIRCFICDSLFRIPFNIKGTKPVHVIPLYVFQCVLSAF
jgi:hypothetical protein